MSGWNGGDVQHLADLSHRRAQIEAEQRALVGRLRQQECPWSVIGLALGVSKQAAAKKYGAERVSVKDRALPLADGPEPSQRRPLRA